MQQASYPLRVSGSIKLDRGVWRSRLRISDPTKGCGYRDERRAVGPAWTGKGEPAPGTFNRRTAKLVLAERITEARYREHDRRTQRQSFEAGWRSLRAQLDAEGCEAKTVLDYAAIMRERLLPEFGSRALDQITSGDVIAYRDRLLAEGRLSARSIRRDVGLVNAVYRHAIAREEVDVNPAAADRVKRPRLAYDPHAFNVLTADQVRAVANAMPDAHGRAMVLTAAFAGLRLGELLALRWGDVQGDRLHVRRSFNGREKAPKNGKGRTTPIVLELRRALDELGHESDDGCVFTAEGSRPAGDRFRQAFYTALDAVGLGHLRNGDRPIRVHDLRHTFASLAIGGGAPITAVQAWCGHSSLAITSRYSHWQDGADDAALLGRALGEVAA